MTIVDLRGLSLSLVKKDNRAFIKSAMGFSAACYPETVHKIFIVNSPTFFSMIWKVVRPWVDPVTADKLQVMGVHSESKLHALTGLDIEGDDSLDEPVAHDVPRYSEV